MSNVGTLKKLNSRKFNEEKDKDLIMNYYVTVDDEDEVVVKRNLKLLLEHMASMGPGRQVEVRIFNPHQDPPKKRKESPVKLVEYALVEKPTTISEAINILKDRLVTPQIVLQQLLATLSEFSEFCDVNTVCVTGLFDTHGIAGTTYANPYLEITEPRAKMMYESIKAHAEAYKDQMNKTYGMKIGSDIIIPGGSGGGLLDAKGRAL